MVEETELRVADEKRLKQEAADNKQQQQEEHKSILKKADAADDTKQDGGVGDDVTSSKRTGTDSKETFALSKTGKVKKSKWRGRCS